MAAKRVTVKDRGWVRIQLALRRLDGYQATIGLHPDSGQHKGEISNVGLGVVHEFGVQFMHPGGTPFMVTDQGGSSRSGGMVYTGAVVFLRKGDPRAIGITQPHIIQIPERSFVRSTWDKKVRGYERLMMRQAVLVIDGKAKPQEAIGRVGEKVLADVRRTMNRGVPPPLKPETIRRKRSSKPLIDTAQLKQALTVKVFK
jgi:hypothetical protein